MLETRPVAVLPVDSEAPVAEPVVAEGCRPPRLVVTRETLEPRFDLLRKTRDLPSSVTL